MGSAYEYIISIQDKASSSLQRIAGTSLETVDKMVKLSEKAEALQRTTKDLGGSLGNLRQKVSLLRDEKELLDPKNMPLIKQYNREIAALEKQIGHLDNAGSSGGLKRYFGELGGMLGGMVNPATVTAAIGGFSGKSAMNFDKGMAAVNLTAQLDDRGLTDLSKRVKRIALDNKTEIEVAPVGFEKIISQVGDADASLKILDASMKGARATTTDMDTVSGALAQTMSIVGTKNADVQQVLDTFIAAKRVGAGEFKDFATYMPGLIAGADSLGVGYKSVAGVFAYMTGKGQSAERSATLMQNMFSAMSKTDITKNLKKAGVAIFDNEGKMRSMVDIFTDLNKLTGSMSAEQKSAFLEQVGIVDKEAKSAFAVMASDVGKLKEAMDATANAQGETAKALELSKNAAQKANDVWVKLKNTGFILGDMILPVISVGFDILGGAVSAIFSIFSGASAILSWWSQLLADGNPLVWGLTAALAALTVGLGAYAIVTNSAAIATKAKVAWDWIAAGAASAWTAVQWALNASLYACPLVWIVLAIGALVAAIVFCVTKVQGWGKQWDSIVSFMKAVFELFVESFRFRWNLLTNGFMLGLDKIRLGWYKFKEAVGLGDSKENQGAIARINADVEARQKAIAEGAKKVRDLSKKAASSLTWELSMKTKEKASPKGNGAAAAGGALKAGGTMGKGGFDGLMDKLQSGKGKGKRKGGSESLLDLNGKAASYKGTTAYSAIASRLAPVKLSTLAAAASVAVPMATAPAITSGEMAPPQQVAEQQQVQPRQQGKTISVDRLCNSVVINIEKADGKGYDRIRTEVMSIIKETFDDYA